MPFFALAAGAVGLYLRLMELICVFDELTGLPQRGARETITLIVFSAAVLLIAFLLSLRVTLKYKALPGFENAFGTAPLSYPLVFTLIGIVWFGATVKHFFELRAGGWMPQIELYFLILSALSAISVAFFAIEMYQDPRRRIIIALSIVPSLFMCFWLVIMYRQNATNPILLSYAYYCLAIISSALGFYFTSGFVYNKPAPGKAIFSYLAAIYFCFVTLADSHSTSTKIIFAVIIAINVVYSSMLIRNLEWKNS